MKSMNFTDGQTRCQNIQDMIAKMCTSLTQEHENALAQITSLNEKIEDKDELLKQKDAELLQKTRKIEELEDAREKLKGELDESQKNLSVLQNDKSFLKNKIRDYSLKTAEFEKRLVIEEEKMNQKTEEFQKELEKKVKEYNAEIEFSSNQVADLQKNLEALEALIESDYVTLEEYNNVVADMQEVLDQEKNDFNAQLSLIQEEIDQDAQEKEEMMMEYEGRVQGLQEKNENLEKDNQKKAAEIQECLEGMTRMKETLESYQESLIQFEELKGVRQENNELKLSHKKQEEMINHLHKSFSEYYRSQEVEMDRFKGSYKRLQEESESIKANLELKEAEILRLHETQRIALEKQQNLLNENKELKENELNLQKAKEDEEIARLSELNIEIQKQVETKEIIMNNLKRSISKDEQLQKKLEEDIANRRHTNQSKLGSISINDIGVQFELSRLKDETQDLKNQIFTIHQLLMEAFIHLKHLPQQRVPVEHARELVSLIKRKEKEKADQEKNVFEIRSFDIQLIDKSLEEFKQNYYLALNHPPTKLIPQKQPMRCEKSLENKENTDDNVMAEKAKLKEVNMSKISSLRSITGVKRTMGSLNSNSLNQKSNSLEKLSSNHEATFSLEQNGSIDNIIDIDSKEFGMAKKIKQ